MSAIAKRMALVGCGLLVAALAMAQALPPAVTQGQLTPAGTGAVTTGPLTLVVDPANGGNDSNTCTGYGAGACGGMQAAEQKIPKNIRHAVKVVVDGGSYACSTWDGFTFGSDVDAGVYGTLWVDGVEVPAQVAGLDSGTVASATDFVIGAPNVAPTVTVTGAGWTVNALQGLWFHFDTGTGAGQELAITSNTATVITLAGGYEASTASWVMPSSYTTRTKAFKNYVVPDATTTFSIIKNAASIASSCALPAGPGGQFAGGYANASHNTYGFLIAGMRGSIGAGSFDQTLTQLTDPQAPVLFSHFDFNDATTAGASVVVSNSDSVQLRWLSYSNGWDSCITWHNVRRLSVFSNSATNANSPMLLHPDGYSGDELLLFGNVVGNAANTVGSLTYLNYSPLLWPRQIFSGLNAYRFGGNVLSQNGWQLSAGNQSFYSFGDFFSGYNSDGINIAGPGAAQVQADTFTGKTGANAAIAISNFVTYQGKQNVGSTGQKYGYRIGTSVNFSASIGNTADTLTGTIGDICMNNPSCTDIMSNATYFNNGYVTASSTPSVQGGQYENRYNGPLEAIYAHGDAGVDDNFRVGGAVSIGGGATITKPLSGTKAVTGASIGAGACANQGTAITETGAAAGDACFLGLSASPGNGLAYSCVTSSNACQIVACNASAGSLTSLTGTHTCFVIH